MLLKYKFILDTSFERGRRDLLKEEENILLLNIIYIFYIKSQTYWCWLIKFIFFRIQNMEDKKVQVDK